MTQPLVAPTLDFGGTPSMCVVVSNRGRSRWTPARNNAKRAAEKMIANGKAPAVGYGIRPRDAKTFSTNGTSLRIFPSTDALMLP